MKTQRNNAYGFKNVKNLSFLRGVCPDCHFSGGGAGVEVRIPRKYRKNIALNVPFFKNCFFVKND